jgi:formylglycine-generating enzyme required for sulfatase activity
MLRRLALSVLGVLLAAPAPAADPALTLDLGNDVKLELVLIEKGKFQQGSPAKEKGRAEDETQREVTLPRDFYLGKHLVTRGQWERFTAETGYRTEAERGPSGGFGWDGEKLVQKKEYTWRNPGFKQDSDHPVTIVTYDDALAFCAWLGKKTRHTVRLPTEAEWEYACRAGTSTPFPAAQTEDELKEAAWFKANAHDGTHPVGKKKPNAWGLYDMAGNVFEWCRDWYGPYKPGPVEAPEETRREAGGDTPRRVLRGGSWLREAAHCRCAARYRNTPGSRNADNGFRVLVAVEEKPEKEEARGAAAVPVPLAMVPVSVPLAWTVGDALGFVCVGALVIGALALVFFYLLRRSQQPRYEDRPPDAPRPIPASAPRPTSGIRPRAAADGFWLDAPSLAVGSAVRYRCRVAGTQRTGTFTVEAGPRGQFVYTGGAPTEIEIVEVLPPGSRAVQDWDVEYPTGSTTPSTRPASPPPPKPTPFHGHPAAY